MNEPSAVVAALQELANDLTEESDLVAVVRAQIRIENLVISFVEKLVVNPTALKGMQLGYFDYVSLASALGLPDDVVAPLRTIGKLRNSFAHKLDTVLDTSAVNNLFEQLSSEQKSAFRHTYQQICCKYPNATYGADPAKLPPKDRFQLVAVAIYTSLYSELLKLKPAHGA